MKREAIECSRGSVRPADERCPQLTTHARTARLEQNPPRPRPPPSLLLRFRRPHLLQRRLPPPAPYTPPAVAPPPAYYAAPPQRAPLPTWLLTVLFALAFIGLGAGVYWLVQYFRGGSQAAASAPVETVPVRGQAKQHPLQKYVEVTGIRFVQARNKDTEARFLVVNHSGADIADLAGTVNIWGRTAKSEEEAAGNFNFKVPSLGPYESKEVTAPVTTKLKVYELPDWQNVSTEVQITSP